jgi:hypothetical protein
MDITARCRGGFRMRSIYYEVKAGEVVVCRVLDCRRDPGWTVTQLGKD